MTVHYRLGTLVAVGVLGTALLWLRAPEEQERQSSASGHDLVASDVSVVASPVGPEADEPGLASAQAPPTPKVQPTREAAWRDLDENELMDSLSELSADDAELALRLAREARARFPDSARAAEQAYFEVRSLVNLGRLDEAVTSARALVAAHPHDPLANEVARHLLTHPLTHPTEVGRQLLDDSAP